MRISKFTVFVVCFVFLFGKAASASALNFGGGDTFVYDFQSPDVGAGLTPGSFTSGGDYWDVAGVSSNSGLHSVNPDKFPGYTANDQFVYLGGGTIINNDPSASDYVPGIGYGSTSRAFTDTGYLIEAGYRYTVSISVGNFGGGDPRPFAQDFLVYARYLDSAGDQFFIEEYRNNEEATPLVPTPGTFGTVGFAFDALLGDDWTGKELRIGFAALDTDGEIGTSEDIYETWSQIAFDNLTIERERLQVVPEPTTLLLLGIGLIGLAGLSRKKFLK